MPAHPHRRQLHRTPRGPIRRLLVCRVVARRRMDVSQRQCRRRFPHLAAALRRRRYTHTTRADHLGTDYGGRYSAGPCWPVFHNLRRTGAEFGLDLRRQGGTAGLAGRLCLPAEICRRWKEVALHGEQARLAPAERIVDRRYGLRAERALAAWLSHWERNDGIYVGIRCFPGWPRSTSA